MTKGGLLYTPKELLEEMEDIKVSCKVDKNSDVLRIIAHNSKIAREIKLNLDFGFNKRKNKNDKR